MTTTRTGFWDSPVTEELLTADTNILSNTFSDPITGLLYLVECRPSDQGRYRLLVTSPSQAFQSKEEERFAVVERLDSYTVKSSVHEYGGAPAACLADYLIFVDGYTKKVLLRRPGSDSLKTLRDVKSVNYADFTIHPSLKYAIAIAESHKENHVVDTTLEVIDFETGDVRVIASGNDFYAAPRFSPDGTKLAWVTWNHPSMPWSCAQLALADWNPESGLIVGTPDIVASDSHEAAARPFWASNNALYFISDRSGFFLPYKYDISSKETVPMAKTSMQAEFSGPDWTLGNSSLVSLTDGSVVSSYTLDGKCFLASLKESGDCSVILDGFSAISDLRSSVQGEMEVVFFVGATTSTSTALYAYNVNNKDLSVVRRSTKVSLDTEFISEPDAMQFPVHGSNPSRVSNLFYFPPKNPNYSISDSELPPLLVKCHGGPTSHYTASFALSTQYWTTRGFAVALVNYNGSSSFGRAYRENLNGNWGLMDTEDVCGAAKHLVNLGLVDKSRLCVDGGSSGGYLVLCCVTMYPDVFSMGTSLYGICDLVSLAELTHKFEAHYMEPLLGGTVSQIPDVYRDRSPLNLADRIKSPLLVLQGTEDKVVPPNQSELIVEAIKKRGGDVEYVLFAGEGHGFRKAPNIQKAYETELKFYQTRFEKIEQTQVQPANCLICNQHPIEYACVPCGHETFCKSCAMKQASGGKCRVCHEFFVNPRRIH